VFFGSSLQLEDLWNLEEPSFDYLDRTFKMTYKFSEGIVDNTQTEAKLYLYGNIDDPTDDLNCFQSDAVNKNKYLGASLDLSKGAFALSGDPEYEKNKRRLSL
jgi:hypothetical protein